jgi:hypothetical protein
VSGSALGDLVRAWTALAVPDDPELRAQIAAMLGLARIERAVARVEESRPPDPVPKPPRPPSDTPEWDAAAVPVDAFVTALQRPDDRARGEEMLGGPALSMQRGDLPAPLQKLPLIHQRWERALLAALVAVAEPTDEPDLRKLIALLARSRPVSEIPYRAASSVRQGARIYLDRSRAMEPFAEDQAQVAAALASVAGADKISVHEFEFLPSADAVVDDSSPAVPATAPVVVVSDFGLLLVPGRGPVASPWEWKRWADRLRQAGCKRIAGLLPVVESRWPAALRASLDLLYWDVTASVRTIRSRR